MASKQHFEWRALRWIDRGAGPVRLTDDWGGLRTALRRLMKAGMVAQSGHPDRHLYITDKGQRYYTDLQHDVDVWGHC